MKFNYKYCSKNNEKYYKIDKPMGLKHNSDWLSV